MEEEMDADQFEEIAINFYQNNNIGDEARSTLMSICHDPTSLCLFHTFLFNTHSNEAKFLSLQFLSANILYGWSALSDSDRNKIKTDLFELLIQWCSYIRLKDDESEQNNHLNVQVQLVNQLDNTIIKILFAEWPHGWPNFLNEFISTAKSHIDNVDETGESTIYVFINAVCFMGQLSEQIRNNQFVVSSRKNELATDLSNNFQTIYSFLKLALTIENTKVQIESLNSLSYYFQWIDLKNISSDNIIETILGPIMNNPECRIFALRCILSIVSRDLVVANAAIEQIFNDLIDRVSSEITILEDPNLIEVFVELFSKFICLDRCALMPNDTVIEWMIEYSKMVEDDIFVDVISMWHNLIKIFAIDQQPLPFSAELLVPLQFVLCSRMCKPVEFGGDQSFYDDYSETLSLLLKTPPDDILHIIIEKIDGPQFNSEEMLSWIFTIGAISGIYEPREESELLTTVFSIILRYITPASDGNTDEAGNAPESNQDANETSIAVDSFLYLVGQYTRYISTNRKYLNLALSKIEETIIEGQPDSQLIALHSLKKISRGLGKIMVTTEFSQKLLSQFGDISQQIPPECQLPFLEASMYLVKNIADKTQRDELALEIFERADNIPILTELIPIVDNELFLPTVESMIHSMFTQFSSPETDEQTKKNFYDLFYRVVETFPGTSLLDDFVNLYMEEFNQLISILSNTSTDGNGTTITSATSRSLTGLATIIRAHNEMAKHLSETPENEEGSAEQQNPNTTLVPMVYNDVVVPCFDFIKDNFVDFPGVREHFFVLVQSLSDDCSLLDPDSITTLLDFIFFGLKHPHPYISELSLNCVTNILNQFDKCEDESFATEFYETFYVPLLTNLLALFFDGLHSTLFSQITQTIDHLLSLAASGKYTQLDQQNITEIVFKKLQEMFIGCNEEEIEMVANDIVNSVGNIGKLRSILSDFVIASRQVQITASPSIDEELVEHNEDQMPPELEFLNEQNSGSQIIADSYVFPE